MKRPPYMPWIRLVCGSNKVFGDVAPGSTGTIKCRCTATWCKRPAHDTYHVFNLANGLCVTEHVATSLAVGATPQGVR